MVRLAPAFLPCGFADALTVLEVYMRESPEQETLLSGEPFEPEASQDTLVEEQVVPQPR